MSDEKWHAILVAVLRKRRNVGTVSGLRSRYSHSRLLDGLFGSADFRAFIPGRF
jgi:hypothetical protein